MQQQVASVRTRSVSCCGLGKKEKGVAAVTVSTNVKVPASEGKKIPSPTPSGGEKRKKREKVDGPSDRSLQGPAGGILVPWPGLAPPGVHLRPLQTSYVNALILESRSIIISSFNFKEL